MINSIKPAFILKYEKQFFYGTLLLNLSLLFLTRFHPSMDGPAHIYNSNLLIELIKNSTPFTDLYQINTIPIPNLTSHIILSTINSVMPGWIAEKILILIYFSGLSLSFRYFVFSLNPDNKFISIFIFPFCYSFLFYLGFYNYVLSFIILFLSITFWHKNYERNSHSVYITTGLLLIFAYISNVLTFGYIGLFLGFSILIKESYLKKDNATCLKRITNKLFLLLICSLPSIILLFLFLERINFPSSANKHSFQELTEWIFDARAFIVYNYKNEKLTTALIPYIFITIWIAHFVNRKSAPTSKIREYKLIFIILLFITLMAFYVIPDGMSAGMMSDRLCLMFFFLFLILSVFSSVPQKIKPIIFISVLIVHLSLIGQHYPTIRNLNKNAKAIYECANTHIDSNSIVLPINLSSSWLEPHFSNYLGTDKPIIILENYEIEVGWFPVIKRETPVFLDLKNIGKEIPNTLNLPDNLIDYIFVYGETDKITQHSLYQFILDNFELSYEEENKYIKLYKRPKG